MVQVNLRLIALLTAVMAAAYPLLRLYDPMKPSARLLRCGTMGIITLGCWNLLMPALPLGVNALSAMMTGWLGTPGIALLAFVRQLTP